MTLIGAALLGAAIGSCALLLFALRTWRSRALGAEEIAAALAVPLLGVMPHLSTRGRPGGVGLAYIDANTGRFAEAIRTIRTAVVLAGVVQPWRCIGVVAAAPGAGATALATNLALALGQFEDVLLIDADADGSGLPDWFAPDRAAPGLSELLAGAAAAGACVQRHPAAGIAVVPPGAKRTAHAAPSSAECAAVLAGVAPLFDRIVVDVARDAAAWAPCCDLIVYVVTSAAACLPLARQELARLREAGARIAGVVVNLVEAAGVGGSLRVDSTGSIGKIRPSSKGGV